MTEQRVSRGRQEAPVNIPQGYSVTTDHTTAAVKAFIADPLEFIKEEKVIDFTLNNSQMEASAIWEEGRRRDPKIPFDGVGYRVGMSLLQRAARLQRESEGLPPIAITERSGLYLEWDVDFPKVGRSNNPEFVFHIQQDEFMTALMPYFPSFFYDPSTAISVAEANSLNLGAVHYNYMLGESFRNPHPQGE